jgi:acid phosphatase (class A)
LIKYGFFGAAAALAVAAAAFAQGGADKLSGYMQKGELDGTEILGPPPAVDSPEGQADRAVYIADRSLAGSKRWRLAQRDNDLWQGGAVNRFSCALGVDIQKGAPATYRLLQRVELDVRTVGTPPKNHYDRTRPPIGDDLPICVPREDWMRTNASYPSGHSMTGWAWALILAELRPDHASPLLVAGREIGQSRVVCGVHFQSDVDAGRELGAAMVARLQDHPEFRADLEAARAELAHAHAAPANCDY